MPEQKSETNPTAVLASAAPTTQTAASAAPVQKQFDVALVDPHNPLIECYPRVRVTIEATDEGVVDEKKPPLISDTERKLAIAAYNKILGLTSSDLRYDIVAAAPGSSPPMLPPEWAKHLKSIGLLK